jgi:hypothetical protein
VRLGVVILASVLVNPHLIVYDAAVLVLPLLWFGAYVQERRRPADARVYWTTVYWLCLTFLAPTAAAIGVQASVLLMAWLMVLMTRSVAGGDLIAGAGARDERMARVGACEVTY